LLAKIQRPSHQHPGAGLWKKADLIYSANSSNHNGGKMQFTLDTKFGTLLENPQAKATVEKYLPGVTTNPMVAMVKGMTLKNILAMPQAAQLGLTKEKVEKILAEINKNIK
jgi:hypothetical protein